MDIRLTKLLYGSYTGVLIALVGGALAMPSVFFGYPNHGISFWGSYFPAVVPYSIGFTITAACLFYAAYILSGYPEHLAVMRRLLVAIALGLVFVLMTPAQTNTVFYWVHTLAAMYLYTVTGVGAIWIMLRDGRSRLDRLLFWTLITGSVLSLLSVSFVHVLGVLALGQVLALNAGMLIVVRTTLRWAGQAIKG